MLLLVALVTVVALLMAGVVWPLFAFGAVFFAYLSLSRDSEPMGRAWSGTMAVGQFLLAVHYLVPGDTAAGTLGGALALAAMVLLWASSFRRLLARRRFG